MKILLLYTPRCGSTSILNYFCKVNNNNYKCYNEPWFEWMIQKEYNNIRINYDELITEQNIFVKCTYKTIPVSIDQAILDFDKVVFLLRRNIKDQVESSIIAHSDGSFLDRSKKIYNIFNLTDDDYSINIERLNFLNKTLNDFAIKYNKPLFYYEDLYYGDFTPLFEELEISYNSIYFKEFLNNSNRYRIKIEQKKISTLI